MPRDPFADTEPSGEPEPTRARKNGRRKQNSHDTAAQLIDTRAPYSAAKLFLGNHFTANGSRTLHHHHGLFYRWSGAAYLPLPDGAVRSQLYQFLDKCVTPARSGSPLPVKPHAALVGNVADALRAAAHLEDALSPPVWLDHAPDLPAEEIVPCNNGLLHLPSRALLPHTPTLFALHALDFDFEPRAPEPGRWLAFLDELWPGDPVAIETLREIFGLCITGDTSHQKAFLIVGPKRSGKGTIGRVLTRLIGTSNAAAPSLAALSNNFGLAPLIGARLAIISDARLGSRADQHAITERLLSITGEDNLTIDRKFLPAWTGRLQTRFLILSNELPRLADASGALASRFIMLVLRNSFYGREDRGLTERLFGELPGILNWAITGWQNLTERGYFHQPESAAEAVQEFEDLGSPIAAFLRDRCVVGPGRVVETTRLFDAWCEWSKAQGREHASTAQTFGRDLRAAVPALHIIQPRDEGGRKRMYDGIGLR
jgi:putative DNA primase/helicase